METIKHSTLHGQCLNPTAPHSHRHTHTRGGRRGTLTQMQSKSKQTSEVTVDVRRRPAAARTTTTNIMRIPDGIIESFAVIVIVSDLAGP